MVVSRRVVPHTVVRCVTMCCTKVVVPHGVADVNQNGDDAGPVLKDERCHLEGKRNAGINLTMFIL